MAKIVRSSEQEWRKVRRLPFVMEKQGQIPEFGRTHNWTKHSLFWTLPYWRTCLLRHNLDVMHIKKNVFDNIFHTVMDSKTKNKDNLKARLDIAEICDRPQLHLQRVSNSKAIKPKAVYTLSKEQRKLLCEWVLRLRLPDGYASNFAKCVDMEDLQLSHLKSHDCHVFMEKLLPIAFKDFVPEPIWNAMTEVSMFFKSLCCTILNKDEMKLLNDNIIVTVCKLEKIFPPGFFDSMEHLIIHLPEEARLGGPVQYRWMYPFERFLHKLKKIVKNKAIVEGSIAEAYILQEISDFGSLYFDTRIQTRWNTVSRNDDGGVVDAPEGCLSIFSHPGRGTSRSMQCYLTNEEYNAAIIYILLNTPEVYPYVL